MKLTWRQIDPFLKNPDPAARVVLVYGPDEGLMRERAAAVGRSVVADLNDPFNVAVLSGDAVASDPAQLADEAAAMSMMGGARLIRIERAEDKLAPALRAYLDAPSDTNLVVIEAGDLGPRSPLRQLCEKAKNAAALPCYVEDARGTAQLARQTLTEAGWRIDNDALNVLAAAITGDRALARAELEKLLLYLGPVAQADNAVVSLDDVQAVCASAGAASLDDLIHAVAGGQTQAALNAFSRLNGEGVAVITILRTLLGHFRRLHYIEALMQRDGISAEQAMKALQPPVFFKYEPAFKAQLQRWKAARLLAVMDRLSALEAQTKRTGAPVETLCAQAILSVSTMR